MAVLENGERLAGLWRGFFSANERALYFTGSQETCLSSYCPEAQAREETPQRRMVISAGSQSLQGSTGGPEMVPGTDSLMTQDSYIHHGSHCHSAPRAIGLIWSEATLGHSMRPRSEAN